MAKRYARLNWQNKPSVATPINATNLNKMDKGIDDIDTALNNLENSIVGQIVNDPTKINNAAVNYSLAQQITQLNNNLAVNEYKSSIAFISGLTAQSDIRYSLKKSGKLVVFNTRLEFATSDTRTAEFQIATLPPECVPATDIFAPCTVLNSSFKVRLGLIFIHGNAVRFTPNLVVANDVDTKFINISIAWYTS